MAAELDSQMPIRPLDLDYARAQFPSLAGPQVFMDNAGGSLTLASVADRIHDYLLHTNVQLGASYATSALAAERYAEARWRLAAMVNAPSPEEVVFGASTTLLLKLLASSFASTLEPGDEIIVSRVDHEANIGCWLALESSGARLRFWERDADTGELALADLDRQLGPRTRLVCVSHVSNILGSIHPIRQIADRVHAAGALLCVDGVAFAPHRAIDVQALGIDFYALSLYKVYGPHFAMLYARREPFLDLGVANHFFYGPEDIPGKLEPGNANYELAWGSAGVVDYLEALGASCMASETSESRSEGRVGLDFGASGVKVDASDKPTAYQARDAAWQAIAVHEEALSERLLAFLRERTDLRIIGRPESDLALRVPTISFVHARLSSSVIVEQVDPHGIGIRFGHFYAHRLVTDLGLHERDGVVRVSMVHYNRLEEVDRLIAVLEPILDG